MNKILSNISNARGNPHAFWPLVIAAALYVVPQIVFKALDIYAPQLVGKDAMMQDMLAPYIRDLVQILTGYGTMVAATSGPQNPPPPLNPPPTDPPALKP